MSSEWTIGTLKEHFEALIAANDVRYSQRFVAQELAVKDALAGQEKAVNAAYAAQERAILKAEEAQKDYNQRSNEFRGQLDDQAKLLMARQEALGLFRGADDKLEALRMSNEKTFDSHAKEIAALREVQSASSGRSGGFQQGWLILLGAVSLISTLIAIGLGALALLGR